MSTETKKPPVSYPHKGMADLSWPVCATCGGYGVISQELARQGLGAKGDTCQTCNGAGRVPDPAWPACACAEISEECTAVCGGLGQLSPEAQAGLVAKAAAAEAEIRQAQRKLRALERGVPREVAEELAGRARAATR